MVESRVGSAATAKVWSDEVELLSSRPNADLDMSIGAMVRGVEQAVYNIILVFQTLFT
jgi:hypothetical protein